ncbi:MAG: hypothetical protein GY801_22255 [bacterium]|nr:hypothetical protein [bacterium]
MIRYFIHYWSNHTWDYHQNIGMAGELLDHIAGNLFRSRHVAPNDVIYIITVIKGVLFVLAKIQVGKICDIDEAVHELRCSPEELWEANDHIIDIELFKIDGITFFKGKLGVCCMKMLWQFLSTTGEIDG